MTDHAFPVVEIFGPTIQGEGPDAGTPCYFIRLGGCDFRCSWCDSMHAVEPAQVRDAERVTAEEITNRVVRLPGCARLVILSGGNPALHQCGELVDLLHARGFFVSVETQGTKWRPWLLEVDRLVVSPKPPSSGMDTPDHRDQFRKFMPLVPPGTALKVVVFDYEDLAYAIQIHRDYPDVPFFLSAGTPVQDDEEDAVDQVRQRYRWLCDEVALTPILNDARVLPQLHVIAWGLAVGV